MISVLPWTAECLLPLVLFTKSCLIVARTVETKAETLLLYSGSSYLLLLYYVPLLWCLCIWISMCCPVPYSSRFGHIGGSATAFVLPCTASLLLTNITHTTLRFSPEIFLTSTVK
ncbi:hypothetical protein B0H34DRAFT_420460 [Crassisporium funariophilum]|nr:hypothetical protein B0H34DRAFT_420460 [Crassisporium funariophilum]